MNYATGRNYSRRRIQQKEMILLPILKTDNNVIKEQVNDTLIFFHLKKMLLHVLYKARSLLLFFSKTF